MVELEDKKEIINKVVNDNADSICIGTPAKGGAIKLYGDFSKVDEFKAKIDNAKVVKQHAIDQLGE